MTERLWEAAAALSDALREMPKISSLLRAFDADAGEFAGRVSEVTARYSFLQISPLLLGVRLNHMPVTAQLMQGADDEAWLRDAVEAGAAFQVVVEFLRSRLPGYPVLRVPHRRPGSAYLIETDECLFHHFPWERQLSRLGLQQAGPPDLKKLGGSDDCAEMLNDLVAKLAERPAWLRFADAHASLSPSDRTTLSEIGKRFAAEVAEAEVVKHAGDRLMAQYEYRIAVLEEHVASTSGAVLEYLRAFEEVDELISIVAAFIQTLVVRQQVASVVPKRIDLGKGGEVVPVNLLTTPDPPFLNPGETFFVQGPPAPEGVVYPEGVQHSWGTGDDPESSTAEVEGKFIAS